MRRRNPRPLAHALEALTDRLAPATLTARTQRAWAPAVGEAIAGHGDPVAVRDGVLEVRCADAVWAAELELMGPELVGRLNAALGGAELTSLRCRTGGPVRRKTS